MERRTLVWVIVGAVVLMATGFYLSSVLNLSQQVSLGIADHALRTALGYA
jgi:putative effector of murein hydrolase